MLAEHFTQGSDNHDH
jgi:hypothetical protein